MRLALALTWTLLALAALTAHATQGLQLRALDRQADRAGIDGALRLGATILLVNQITRSVKMLLLVLTGAATVFLPSTRVAGLFLIPVPMVSLLGAYLDRRFRRRLWKLQESPR